MSWTSILAIYFVLWWVVLFAVLPWGVRSQQESGDITHGTDPGAPAAPRLVVKMLWTTLVSALLFAGFSWAYATKAVDLERLGTLWGLLR
jgi:predicted secreted protein